MCEGLILRNNGGPQKFCAPCLQRRKAIQASLPPAKVRQIDRFLKAKPVEAPEPPTVDLVERIDAFLLGQAIDAFLADDRRQKHVPLSEIDKRIQEEIILYERKARRNAIHYQHREALLKWGEGL
jgi:hypothetical protein